MTVIKAHSPGTSQIEEKDLGEEHAKRYGRHKGYKKGSYVLGWKIQPRTPIQGRTKYRWGNLKDLYPPNLANPLTCRIPSLIDFLETRQPKYFFYTLEDWDFENDSSFPVEKELVYKTLMYWRLMLFTGEIEGQESKIVQYYLNTANKIISGRMPIFGYWPYKNGLVHFYKHGKEHIFSEKNSKSYSITYNPSAPSLFYNYFNSLIERLFQYERDIKLETNLLKKESYWIKVIKSVFEKKEIPGAVVLKTSFNYQNLNLVVASYIAWEHNNYKLNKNEPKFKLLADWKQIYTIYKEVLFLKEKKPELFESEEMVVTKMNL